MKEYMSSIKVEFGKILYALLFICILPVLLVLWSRNVDHLDLYPAIESVLWGRVICVIGGFLMLWGMLALWKYGNGLPMNAYPPEKFVVQGPYRIVRHPIYWGFGFMLVGCSIMLGSAAGLWLIAPVVILSMVALVMGYERIDLARRFPGIRTRALFEIVGSGDTPSNLRDKVSAVLLVFAIFFLGSYLILQLHGNVSPLIGGTRMTHASLEGLPLSFLSLVFTFCVPLVLKRQIQIRTWTISMLMATALSVYLALIMPQIGAQYFSVVSSTRDTTKALIIVLTSVPVFLILISLKTYIHRFRRYALFFYGLAFILCAYQMAVSQSSILHLVEGVVIFLLAAHYRRIWIWLKRLAEKVANSWTEWVFGPVRIINHGIYVGLGSFCGILLTGWLAGKSYAWAILIFALVVIVFSGLWAQLVEGSEKLKRPFGYYGALVGIIFASLVVWGMGYHVWVIIGVISVVAPWAQAVGRLRCLVNGCCHGRPTSDQCIGIRYSHYRSRVCGLSGLKGELLHPTPLYSILWLVTIGFVLLACWNHGLPYSFIFGLYLILTGIGRFVEEAYRGEVQTPVWKGLHLYQWTAIASLIIGIVITVIPIKMVAVHPEFGWEILVSALLGGLFTFFAMGVDFPRSNARFSRLV